MNGNMRNMKVTRAYMLPKQEFSILYLIKLCIISIFQNGNIARKKSHNTFFSNAVYLCYRVTVLPKYVMLPCYRVTKKFF